MNPFVIGRDCELVRLPGMHLATHGLVAGMLHHLHADAMTLRKRRCVFACMIAVSEQCLDTLVLQYRRCDHRVSAIRSCALAATMFTDNSRPSVSTITVVASGALCRSNANLAALP
jgi:hypothetical protein